MTTTQADPAATDGHPLPATADADAAPATQRAERIVDDVADRVGRWTATAGHALLRWTARAREEAEDIWAEAQAVRRGGKP